MIYLILIYVIGFIFTAIYLGREKFKSEVYDNLDFIYIALSIIWPIVWIIKLTK
jgi:hypothetical protein